MNGVGHKRDALYIAYGPKSDSATTGKFTVREDFRHHLWCGPARLGRIPLVSRRINNTTSIPAIRARRARERAYEIRRNAIGRAGSARDVAVTRAGSARDAAVERAGQARDKAVDRASAIRDSASETIRAVKPRFRGVSHEWAFFLSIGLGIALLTLADSTLKLVAVAIYSLSLCGLFGTSALYHRINWRTSKARMLMRRLDHSMIFLLIAGTVTPFALLTMSGTWSAAILISVWTAAALGIAIELIWTTSPKWVSVVIYALVGWIGAIAFPHIIGTAGIWAGVLVAVGGALYTTGAVVYAIGRPNPNPALFGYHEIFHLFVIGAAALHFAAIAFFTL